MVREEIIAMEAGEELDRLVAEEIFLTKVRAWDTFQGKPIYQMRVPSAYGEIYIHLLQFSTDISAAWGVEQKVRELGLEEEYGVQLFALIPDGASPSAKRKIFSIAHAGPEVRCKAALLTKMGASEKWPKRE